MINKRVIAVLILSVFLAPLLYAKTKQPVEKPVTVDDIVAKMKVQLELTDAQAVDVKPIVEDYLAQEKLLRLEEKKQLSKVLTGQQLYSWEFLLNEPQHEKKKP
jgi:hypothetical protein